ncbi:MAG: hypothetical protein ACFUZC_05045 [Chthoniobacteraceae bacterium]
MSSILALIVQLHPYHQTTQKIDWKTTHREGIFAPMRPALLFALLLLPLAPAAFGRDTAYQALRTVGSQRSQSALNNVVEVKGRNGSPQPSSWIILLNDPAARGGVRELEVAKNRIISERTPVKEYSGQSDGAVLNFSKLNLDSEGAFSVAENEVRNSKLGGFYAADYLLRRGDNGTPIWIIQLLDQEKHSLGSITIAADTGVVLARSFESTAGKSEWAATGGLKARLIKFSDATGRTLQHSGEKIREFWDGQ